MVEFNPPLVFIELYREYFFSTVLCIVYFKSKDIDNDIYLNIKNIKSQTNLKLRRVSKRLKKTAINVSIQ